MNVGRHGRPLEPRNGHTLVVAIVARISGCSGQKEVSLDDQVDHAKQVVREMYGGPVEYRVITTKGKGERLDRPELAEIEALIRSGELDLLVAEDLGRIVRGTAAAWLCGIAKDHGTRVVAPNDCIDTADSSWEQDVISACRDHVGHNDHTSKRIKQKLMNRFQRQGAATPLPVFGYVKPEGAKTFDDWRIDPAATPIIRGWFLRLLADPNCTAVADWLNREGVPVGPYKRREGWDGATVRRLTANPLFKGVAARGFRHSVKHHETGRRISVPNPDGPATRDCPHLAHVDASLWDDVNALLTEANRGFGRKPVNGADPRHRVPRKRTRFPGQHARCHYCGRQYVWGGNGRAGNLMCNGSRDWKCWNSVGFDGGLAARKVVAAIADELGRLDGFDDQLRALVERARREGGSDRSEERARREREGRELDRQLKNTADAIADLGLTTDLKEKRAAIEVGRREAASRLRELDRSVGRPPELPDSAEGLRRLFGEAAAGLAEDSFEFGDLLRRLVPEFRVHLVRSVDGGHPLPRARVVLRLAGLVPDAGRAPDYDAALSRELEIDLFEPTQRERVRHEAARLEAEGLEQRDIARRLGVTQPAVFNALQLERLMRGRGLDSPYAALTAPPGDYAKLRRHENRKYRFEPEEGYEPPAL